jgi:hypothetical protein
MTPQSAGVPGAGEIYELLRRGRQPVAAMYDGLPRLLCPHVLGRKAGRPHAFVYQFGGSSSRGLPTMPGGVGVWRCLAVEKLSQVALCEGEWHSEPRSRQQTCIDEIDFDVDAQPGDDPQKGQ